MRTLNLKLFLSVVLITFWYRGSAQSITPAVRPPSANASALVGSIEIPVSYYTGVPNINIPLVTIHSGKIELPVSLSYNASGIRVAQEASNVGLGWSLNAGGVITRQMRGSDDIEGNGYYNPYNVLPDRNYSLELPSNQCNELWPQYGCVQQHVDHTLSLIPDGEPDIFYYNFLGYSGKFVIEKQHGNVIYGTSLDQNSIIIVFDPVNKNWTITDEKGWVYSFITKEYSRSGSRVVFPSVPLISDEGPVIISSWYLDKITTPGNDEIRFLYYNCQLTDFVSSAKITEEKRLFMETDFTVNGEPGFARGDFSHNRDCVIPAVYHPDCGSPGDWVPYDLYHMSGFSTTLHWTQSSEVALYKIIFEEGYLIFSQSETRLDIAGGTVSPNAKSKLLDNIGLFNNKNENVKNFTFDYSYFNQDKLYSNDKERFLRLKLDRITEYASFDNGQVIGSKPFLFTYWEPQLPAKDTYSIDNWGYYNGADNTMIQTYDFHNILLNQPITINNTPKSKLSTLLPMYAYIGTGQDKTKIFINGANREPDEDYIIAGMLKEITYPTGGHTHFEYECNDYSQIGQETYELQTQIEVNSDGTQQASFILEEPSFILLKFELINHNYQNDPNAVGIMENMTAKLTKADGTIILRFIPATPEGSSNNNTPYMIAYVCCALNPGTYNLNVNNGGYVYLDISLATQILKKGYPDKIKAGGTRIKSIKNYENNQDTASITEYRYENSDRRSSGKLLTKTINYYNESNLINVNLGASPPSPINTSIFHLDVNSNNTRQNFVVGTSSSRVPLGASAQGQTIGYSRVIEEKKGANGNVISSKEFHFRNINDDYYLFFFPDVPNLIHNENGQLLRQLDLNANGNIVKSREYTYYPAFSKKIPAIRKIFGNTWGYRYGITFAPILLARFYDVKSEWWYVSNIEDVTYDYHELNPVSINTQYLYDNETHKFPSYIIKTIFEGTQRQNIVEHYLYPDDFTCNTAFINSMKNRHIINKPIRVDKIVNENLIGGEITEFTDFGEPKNTYIYECDGLVPPLPTNGLFSIPPKFTIDKSYTYDIVSNRLIEVNNKGKFTQSLIWENNSNSVIAIANNVGSSSIGYTSFENNELNGWTKYPTNLFDPMPYNVFTGARSMRVENGYGPFQIFTVGQNVEKYSGYKASVWAKGKGAYIHIEVNGEGSSHVRVSNEFDDGLWHKLEVELPRHKIQPYFSQGENLKIKVYVGTEQGTVYFDDLRFHPSDAQMTTYTHEPLIGVTSISNESNKPEFYIYDSFGRLEYIKDFEGNIIKKNDYHYRTNGQ